MIKFTEVNGIEDEIDFDAAYTVHGYRGIAFLLLGWAVENEPVKSYYEDEDGNECECESGEFEEVADRTRVVAVMVGDDRRHLIDRDDLTVLEDEAFCHVCGQVGCTHDGR